MANKQAILENVDMYSADELVEYIRQGVVTFEELCEDTEGEFSVSARRAVRQKLHGSENEEWQRARNSNDIAELQRFVSAYPSSVHANEARQAIEDMQAAARQSSAEEVWKAVDKESIPELKAFCENHPTDAHVSEAKRKINELRKEEFLGFDIKTLETRIKSIQTSSGLVQDKAQKIYEEIVRNLERQKISHADLLDMIKADHNVLGAETVNKLLENGCLGYDDFDAIGIKRDFIRHLVNGEKPQGFSNPRTLEKINRLSTEVYLWGIPSSGKSCALGAILSVAGNGRVARSMRRDNDCQGYGYMNRLAALFRSDTPVVTLPEGTSIFSTYEMGFDLEDQDGNFHPLTCVDLAGELVRCMYKSDAGAPMSEDVESAMDPLTNILIDNRSRNRKMHFFVLEYGADDRKYEGLTQSVYLDGALRYIERSGIFKNDTDAIYLMVSKADKAKAGKGQLQAIIREYIQNAYGGFYNGLVRICHDCEINGGKVENVPFSLGEVWFQDYSLLDGRAAGKVVRELIERSKGFRHGRSQRILNIFKK